MTLTNHSLCVCRRRVPSPSKGRGGSGMLFVRHSADRWCWALLSASWLICWALLVLSASLGLFIISAVITTPLCPRYKCIVMIQLHHSLKCVFVVLAFSPEPKAKVMLMFNVTVAMLHNILQMHIAWDVGYQHCTLTCALKKRHNLMAKT